MVAECETLHTRFGEIRERVGGAEPIRMRKVERFVMQSLNGSVERRLCLTPPLPTPTVLLAGLAALNIASAVLALLAA
jgi:hypothetical protein